MNLKLEQQKVKEADLLAETAHKGQTRKNSLIPYIVHPRTVKWISRQIAQTYQEDILKWLASAGWNYGGVDLQSSGAQTFNLAGWEWGIVLAHIEQVALLHDVVEDTEVTMDDLAAYGFHPYVLSGVAAVTKNPVKGAESYLNYLIRVISHIYSRVVKLADLAHNSSDLKPGNMLDKYVLAQNFLSFRPIVPPTR